jgi:GT2 family glycosyltransferase
MPPASAQPSSRARDESAAGVPVLAVVIVSWNSGPELLDCLRSLHENPPSPRWEAIVVDNASSDGSLAAVRSQFPGVRVIANGANRGLAAANNQGMAATRAEFILISNPDVIYSAGAIDALLALMRRHARAAFAVPKLLHPDGALQTAAGELPTVREALVGQWLSRRRAGNSGVWWHAWPHDEERTIGHGAEACYLVRRRAVGEIGVQDERFVLDWEGVEWSRRAWRAGWEIWFCPQAAVVHLGGVSVRRAPGRWVISTHLGMYRYTRVQVPVALRPMLALAVAMRAAVKLAALAAGARVYQRAHRDGG